MTEIPRKDPLRLDPTNIALLQLMTVNQDAMPMVEALERSSMFEVEVYERGALAEWIRYSAEDDRSAFPFGRLSIFPLGTLLETFSEERMDVFRSRVNELGLWRITPDQVRVLRIESSLERPTTLLHPIHELKGETLETADVAELYLRMAWPFFPRDDLEGRAPHSVVRTGRGRAALEKILPRVGRELCRSIRGFPNYREEELRSILLSEEIPSPEEIHQEKHHPADDTR